MKRSVRKLQVGIYLLLLTAFMVLSSGLFIGWRQHKANQKADHHARRATETTAPSTAQPPPDEFSSYTVLPDRPRYLFIPSISVRSIVQPVALTKGNQVGVPSNIFYAGWYTGSVKPGQSGAMLIDGHVSSWTSHGVFYNLKKLKPGDVMNIERGDGVMLNYKVVKNQTYKADAVDMSAVLAPINPEKPGLNLITCDGNVTKGTNEFEDRLVVFTEQI